MSKQFRAVVVCSFDPCSFCRAPASRMPVEHPAGPFLTEEGASRHGWRMARNVYGSSVHKVEVESREVTEWVKV